VCENARSGWLAEGAIPAKAVPRQRWTGPQERARIVPAKANPTPPCGVAALVSSTSYCQPAAHRHWHQHQPVCNQILAVLEKHLAHAALRSIGLSRPWPAAFDVEEPAAGSRCGGGGCTGFRDLTLPALHRFWLVRTGPAGSCGRSAQLECVCRRPPAWAFGRCRGARGSWLGKVRADWAGTTGAGTVARPWWPPWG